MPNVSCLRLPRRLSRPWACFAVLAAAHTALQAWLILANAPVLDEVAHLPAGISHWRSGNFDLYRVNPPLVRLLASGAVLAVTDPATDWRNYSADPLVRSEFAVGLDFLRANQGRSVALYRVGRWACLPLTLCGGLCCFLWSKELFDARCGVIAASLWFLCPNVLGWGATMMPDAGAASLAALAGYTHWRWLRRPSWFAALVSGAACGAAILSKATLCVLPAAFLCTTAVAAWRGGAVRRGTAKVMFQVLAMNATAIYAVNLGYGFEGYGRRLDEFRFVSRALGGHGSDGRPGNRFEGTALGRVPVPLPANLVMGIDVQKADFEQRKWSYLYGEQQPGGWWYYYFWAAAVKIPIGTWLLTIGAIAAATSGAARRRASDEASLWVPLLCVVLLVSSQTGFSRHFRYLLPALPFWYVLVSRVGLTTIGFQTASSRGVAACLLANAIGVLCVMPHCLSYFNVVAGGPNGGARHLLDSNIDWGQDLLKLKEWYDANPSARPLHVAYFGYMNPAEVGIDCLDVPPLPEGADPATFRPRAGWYAVSVNHVYGYRHDAGSRGEYGYFRRFTPAAKAGYSIWVYYLK